MHVISARPFENHLCERLPCKNIFNNNNNKTKLMSIIARVLTSCYFLYFISGSFNSEANRKHVRL